MSKKRLLVIEDDTDVAEMLQVYFMSQGYEVYNAHTGSDGVAMARAKSPNLILLDVMLPDMDGFDVCRALRTTALTRHIPITFLTQRDRRVDKIAGLELGADDYVTKPFDIDELRLRVQTSLRRASRETLHDIRTGLPTAAVLKEAQKTLEQLEGWTHLDVHMPGFKIFRDVYGFVAGDEVLAFAGRTIIEVIAEYGTKGDIAAIVSDDLFTIITFTNDVVGFRDLLKSRFDEGVRRFYSYEDSERGYIIYHEARDDEQFVPMAHFVIRKIASKPGRAPNFALYPTEVTRY